MIQDNNNGRNGYEREPEQIDLIDLLMQLWRGKLTIIVCVVVAVALAVAYFFSEREMDLYRDYHASGCRRRLRPTTTP